VVKKEEKGFGLVGVKNKECESERSEEKKMKL